MLNTRAIDVDGLQRFAKQYEPMLQTLPFTVIGEELAKLGINLIEVANKETLVEFQRKGGISRPYKVGNINYAKEIGREKERTIQVLPCVAPLIDHIMNYKEKLVATNNIVGEKVDNQGKKHPLEYLILSNVITTVSEDILDSIYPAERDEDNDSPMGMLDGFDTLIDKEIASSDISENNGNLVPTGTIAKPVDGDDTNAYDRLVDFVRAAHPQLRKNCILSMTPQSKFWVMDALKNKNRYKDQMLFADFLAYLRDSCDAPNLNLVTSQILGTGGRWSLSIPGNFDLGMNTISDKSFVQVRNPFEDPNIVQFWNQFELGARVRSIHCKKFQVNDQHNLANELSGDYLS